MDARRKRQALAGLCLRCGHPATPYKSTCERCRQAMREYRRKRAEMGLCHRCGSRLDGEYATCSKCREASIKAEKQCIAEGRCIGCGVKWPLSRLCPECRTRKSNKENLTRSL